MLDPETLFTDEEVRDILGRASDRQERVERASVPARRDLTLSQLESVARDAGISPAHVRAAAQETVLRREAPPVPSRLGIPMALTAQRIVPGEVTDAQWERVVESLRASFGKYGTVSDYGTVREWISSPGEMDGTRVRVRLERREGATAILAHQDIGGLANLPLALGGAFSGVALLGLLIAIGDFGGNLFGLPAAFLTLAVLAGLGSKIGVDVWTKRQRLRIESALDRTELIARTSSEGD